eukprot:m.196359 g.196359  ORF g.196359 m.196359 type:complete len:396 (-) comp15254_c0_seq1:2573-3760(-)
MPVIEAVLYSEFNVTLGPQLVFQSPPDFFSKEQFGNVDKYLISKPELAGKVLTVRTERHRLVSCPIHIIGDRYPRNYLLFNVAAVFAADVDVAPFEPVVRKLALALRSVELETGYIVGEGKSHLQRVLDSVRWELNHSGRVDVPIDLANTLRLQIPSAREVCPQVELQEVPVPLVDLKALPREHLDWAITEILPYIDGANYAKAIAERSEVHIAIVLKALSCLAARRLVAMVPAFQFHSLYLVTREVGRLLVDAEFQRQCEHFTHFGSQPCLGAPALFELYCSFTPRDTYWTVADFLERHNCPKLGVDVRRFIYFGVIHRLLRKVARHPIRDTGGALEDMKEADIESFERVEDKVPAQLLEGNHTTDQICCDVEISFRQLGELLDSDPYTHFFYR